MKNIIQKCDPELIKNQQGIALLENVFVLITALVLICGLTDLCRIAYTLSALSGAAQEAVREMSTPHGSGRSLQADTRTPTVSWRKYVGTNRMGSVSFTNLGAGSINSVPAGCRNLAANQSCEPYVDTHNLSINPNAAPQVNYHLDNALANGGLAELQSALPRAKLGCSDNDCLNASYRIVANDGLTDVVEVRLTYKLPLFILNSESINLSRTVQRRLETGFTDNRVFHKNQRTDDIAEYANPSQW